MKNLQQQVLCLILVLAGIGPIWAAPVTTSSTRPTTRVTTHQISSLTIEEHRVNGQIRNIKIKPKGLPAYILPDFNTDGSLETRSDDFSRALSIPHWTLSNW